MEALFSKDVHEGQRVILNYYGTQYPSIVDSVNEHSGSFYLRPVDELGVDTPMRFGVVIEDHMLQLYLKNYPNGAWVSLS